VGLYAECKKFGLIIHIESPRGEEVVLRKREV